MNNSHNINFYRNFVLDFKLKKCSSGWKIDLFCYSYMVKYLCVMDKSLIIIGKPQDFSSAMKDFADANVDIHRCLDHYDAIDFIKNEYVEAKHDLVIAFCGTSEKVSTVVSEHTHKVPGHSIGVVLCEGAEYGKTFDTLQHMANQKAAEMIVSQNQSYDIGEFALALMNKTIEQVMSLRPSILDFELQHRNKQHYYILSNQKIPMKYKFPKRSCGLQRKILRK